MALIEVGAASAQGQVVEDLQVAATVAAWA